jgi:ketosteroid isomerase-like protein
MSYWADDAIYMPPGQPSLVGKEAIRQMVEGSLKSPGFKISWEPQSAMVSKSGDMAYLLEKSQITVADSLGNPKTEYYKTLTVWRKENGTWKNVVEMVNADPRK